MDCEKNGHRYECVVVDLNTQYDYCNCGGACCVTNAAELIPSLRDMIAWVKRNCVPVVSSLETHREREVNDRGDPAHCVDGTQGQYKLPFTTFSHSITIEIDNTLCVPLDIFENYQQVVFRKRTDDLLANPKADRFLTQLPTSEFILFGSGAESSVKALALALLAREKRVTVVGDACGYWDRASADLALRQIEAKGGTIISLEELLRRKLAREHRYPISKNGLNGHRSKNGFHPLPGVNGRNGRNG